MKFEGEVNEIDLISDMVGLASEMFTGALRFENDSIIKIIYFKDGDVLSASTNDRIDSIDEILVRAGKVSKDHVKQALAKRKDSETLGDALLALGFITKKELTAARRMQLVSILRSVSAWSRGSYTLVHDYLPKREEGTIFYLPQIVVELVVTEQDRSKIERELQSGNVVFEKADGFDAAYARLGLNQEADQVVQEIDGQRSATEIAALAQKDSFTVFKLLYAFQKLGLVRGGEEVQVKPELLPPLDEMDSGQDAPEQDIGSAASASSWEVPNEEPPLPPALPVFGRTLAVPVPVRTPESWDDVPSEPPGDVPHFDSEPAASYTPIPTKRPTMTRQVSPKRGGGVARIFFLIVLIAAVGAGGYYFWNSRQPSTSEPAIVKQPPRKSATPVNAPVTATTGSSEIEPDPMNLPPNTASVPPATKTAPPPTKPLVAIVSASPTPPTGDRGEYEKLAQRHLAESRNVKYTVQFELVCQTASVTKAIREGGANVWFLPTTYRNSSCFRVFWGRFENRAQAEAAISSIPQSLRGSQATVIDLRAR